MKYYEITKAEADSIGKQNINYYMAIDPYSGKLKNSNYIIKEDILQWVKDSSTVVDKVTNVIKTKTPKTISKSELEVTDLLNKKILSK